MIEIQNLNDTEIEALQFTIYGDVYSTKEDLIQRTKSKIQDNNFQVHMKYVDFSAVLITNDCIALRTIDSAVKELHLIHIINNEIANVYRYNNNIILKGTAESYVVYCR